MHHLRTFVDSKFYSFSFPSSVVGQIFACVCEVQLRLCVFFCKRKIVRELENLCRASVSRLFCQLCCSTPSLLKHWDFTLKLNKISMFSGFGQLIDFQEICSFFGTFRCFSCCSIIFFGICFLDKFKECSVHLVQW